jgi:hypothetical protein
MPELKDVLEFQAERRIFSLCKTSLEQLEELKIYAAHLEKIMVNAGFEDKEYLQAENKFKLARKKILDITNDSNRELQDLMKKFDIKLKSE